MKRVKPTHRTPKTENPGSGGRGAMRRAHKPREELTAVEALMLPLDHPKIKKAIEEAASILETTEK